MDSPVSLSPKMMTAMVRTNGVNGMAAVWESTAGVWYNKVKIPLCEVIAQIKEVTYVINRLNDFYVKYLLGNEKRKNLTIHFLNAVLYGDETPHITDVSFIDKDKEPKQADGKLVKVAPELWSITDESGAAVTELTDGVLYELRVTVADSGDFDLSETEKEIKLSIVLGK